MLEEIVKNKFYEIYLDLGKNRAYFTCRGFWESLTVVPNYYEDIVEATAKLRPGFSALIDVKELKTPPQDVIELFMKAQNFALEKGLKKSAHIIDAPVVEMASGRPR